jgi:hypothetical protein
LTHLGINSDGTAALLRRCRQLLSVGCGFSKETFAGMRGNYGVAPIPAVRLTMIGRLKSTQISHCTKRGLSPAHLTLARLLSGIIESAH